MKKETSDKTSFKDRKNPLKTTYIDKLSSIKKILQGINKRSLLKDKSQKKINDLYNLLCKPELLIQAFGNIEKGRLTRGVAPETINSINIIKIRDLAEKIQLRQFRFKPVRRIYGEKVKIYKPGEEKKYRPLGIPTFEDRIVQEAIRIILETIYEPIFSELNYNYGFRPKKSPLNNIQKIKFHATGSTIAIEGDIKEAYDNVDHNILISILKKRISDTRFLKFIYQGFKAGILEFGRTQDTLLGVPQGGIASPILFNIYMQEFDEFIHNDLNHYISKINLEQKRVYNPKNKLNSKLLMKVNRYRQNYKKYKELLFKQGKEKFIDYSPPQRTKLLEMRKHLRKIHMEAKLQPSILMKFKSIKITYSRYGDDFIIFTNCTRKFAVDLKNQMESFLKNKLKLTLSPEKTLITNIRNKPARFLGFSIKTYSKRRIILTQEFGYTKNAGWNMIIEIDMKRVIEKLFLRGFINKKCQPIAKRPWSVLQPEEIINRYNSITRGLANYYFQTIDRLTSVSRIFYFLKFSCLSTFAKKYQSKITKITKKYGDPLTIEIFAPPCIAELCKVNPATNPLHLFKRCPSLLHHAAARPSYAGSASRQPLPKQSLGKGLGLVAKVKRGLQSGRLHSELRSLEERRKKIDKYGLTTINSSFKRVTLITYKNFREYTPHKKCDFKSYKEKENTTSSRLHSPLLHSFASVLPCCFGFAEPQLFSCHA